MSDEFRKTLGNSDAALSLRMEARVAEAFVELGWDVQTSVYYRDVDTNKTREIDVVAKTLFGKPEVHKGIGGPIVNVDVVCECKNLHGSNILFFDAGGHESMLRPQHYWIGGEEEIRRIVMQIAKVLQIPSMTDMNAIYEYFAARAYANRGRALRYDFRDYLPSVGVTTQAFRETKGGTLNEVERTDGAKSNPMWNAVRSITSAMESFEDSAHVKSIERLTIDAISFWSFKDIARNIAFYFDVEIARYVVFHPVVVSKAKLWKIDHDAIVEIDDVRLVIRSIDGDWRYVDIVSEKMFGRYLRKTAKVLKAKAERSNATLWRVFDRINWSPAQDQAALDTILQPFLRKIL